MLEIFVQCDPSEFLLICCSKCLSGTSDNLRSNVLLRISPEYFCGVEIVSTRLSIYIIFKCDK